MQYWVHNRANPQNRAQRSYHSVWQRLSQLTAATRPYIGASSASGLRREPKPDRGVSANGAMASFSPDYLHKFMVPDFCFMTWEMVPGYSMRNLRGHAANWASSRARRHSQSVN